MCCLSGSRWRGRIAPVTSLAAIPGIHPWPRPGPREGADGDCSAKLKGCRRLGTALAGASPPAGAWRRPWAARATELSERRAEFPAPAHAKIGNVTLVTRDAAGQAQQIVGNYRPRSTLLLLSRLIGEKLVGTPYAEHFLAGES